MCSDRVGSCLHAVAISLRPWVTLSSLQRTLRASRLLPLRQLVSRGYEPRTALRISGSGWLLSQHPAQISLHTQCGPVTPEANFFCCSMASTLHEVQRSGHHPGLATETRHGCSCASTGKAHSERRRRPQKIIRGRMKAGRGAARGSTSIG